MIGHLLPESAIDALILPVLLLLSLALGRLLAGPLAHTPTHSRLERWLIYWLLGVVAFSWIGTLLAALGLFRWWLLLPVVLALGGWMILRTRGHARPASTPSSAARTPAPAQMAIVILLVAAGWLYARPAASYLLTDDSAVYTIGGIVLARDGSLFYHPQPVFDFSNAAAAQADYWGQYTVRPDDFWLPQEDLLRQFSSIEYGGALSRHYGGFFQWTLGNTDMEIAFLPLPKVWSALVVWLFGPGHAPWAVPFMALTGLAALYGLARRLLGWPTALGATLLLAISLPQVWFARYPLSEMHTQALLLGGVYLLAVARSREVSSQMSRALAIWSALALAALTMLRFEGVVLLAPLAVLVGLGVRPGYWRHGGMSRVWLLTLGLVGGLGLATSIGVSRYYLFTRSLIPGSPANTRLLLAGLLAAMAGGTLLWRYRAQHAGAYARLVGRLVAALPLLVGGAWLLWGAMALWHLLTRDWGSSLAGWLVQYWTRPGLGLSCFGCTWLLWRARRGRTQPDLTAFLGLAALLALGYSYNALVAPVQPWAMRRLVPVVMPALAMGAAALLVKGLQTALARATRRMANMTLAWLAPILSVGLLLALAWGIGQRTRPLLWYQERQGLWTQLQSLADRFPQDAVLLFDNGAVGRRLTPVMELVFGRPSFALYDTATIRSDSPVVDHLIASAMSSGRRVYLLIADGDLEWHPAGWRLLGRGISRLQTPVLASVWGRPPSAADIVLHTADLDVYEVVSADKESMGRLASPAFDVPLGEGSYPYLRRGFYPVESGAGGVPFRWTRGDALVTLPWPEADGATPLDGCLTLQIAAGRPDGEQPTRLVVEAEGRVLYDGHLAAGFSPQTLTLPVLGLRDAGAPGLEVRLQSGTWNPSAYTQGRDQRELGVLLYGIRLQSHAGCASSIG